VGKPGPRVTTAEALSKLEADCASQAHAQKRSAGTGSLREKYKGQVSRRDLEQKVKEARRQQNAAYRRDLLHLTWRGANIVWAMDDTEYGSGLNKYYITNVRDLGAQYVMEPMVKQRLASGAAVAQNLERLFKAHGAPLFLKRDNGSNLCSHEVNAVLAQWMVLPITSPPHHPQFNGAIEWSQGQLKSEIERIIGEQGTRGEGIGLHVQLASHSINHRSSPVLLNRCPCHARATTLVCFGRNARRSLCDWIKEEAEVIFQNMGPEATRRAAWHQAVTRWLTSNGLLTIKKPKRVSTDFEANK